MKRVFRQSKIVLQFRNSKAKGLTQNRWNFTFNGTGNLLHLSTAQGKKKTFNLQFSFCFVLSQQKRLGQYFGESVTCLRLLKFDRISLGNLMILSDNENWKFSTFNSISDVQLERSRRQFFTNFHGPLTSVFRFLSSPNSIISSELKISSLANPIERLLACFLLWHRLRRVYELSHSM